MSVSKFIPLIPPFSSQDMSIPGQVLTGYSLKVKEDPDEQFNSSFIGQGMISGSSLPISEGFLAIMST